jgi:hypothetical protein
MPMHDNVAWGHQRQRVDAGDIQMEREGVAITSDTTERNVERIAVGTERGEIHTDTHAHI